MGCGSSKSTAAQPTTVAQSQFPKGKIILEAIDVSQDGDTQLTRCEQSNNNRSSIREDNIQTIIENGYKSPTQHKIHEQVESKESPETKCTNTPNQRRNSSIAFEVKLDENSSLSRMRRPPKLKKLDHAPVLTAEILAKKQALAEENRQKEIEKKVSRASQRKKNLQEARELDMAVETKRLEIEEKMNAQSRKRARAQAEIVEKQKMRELKAKRVRERAQRIKQGGDDAEFEVDPDETYNADEENGSWENTRSSTDNEQTDGGNTTSTQQMQEKQPIGNENEPSQDTSNAHDFFEE